MTDWKSEYERLIKAGIEADRVFANEGTIRMPDETPPYFYYPDDEYAVKFGIERKRQGELAAARLEATRTA